MTSYWYFKGISWSHTITYINGCVLINLFLIPVIYFFLNYINFSFIHVLKNMPLIILLVLSSWSASPFINYLLSDWPLGGVWMESADTWQREKWKAYPGSECPSGMSQEASSGKRASSGFLACLGSIQRKSIYGSMWFFNVELKLLFFSLWVYNL